MQRIHLAGAERVSARERMKLLDPHGPNWEESAETVVYRRAPGTVVLCRVYVLSRLGCSPTHYQDVMTF